MKNRPGINIVHGSIPATEEDIMSIIPKMLFIYIYMKPFVQLYLNHIHLTPLDHKRTH
jgi:hypothetical protein